MEYTKRDLHSFYFLARNIFIFRAKDIDAAIATCNIRKETCICEKICEKKLREKTLNNMNSDTYIYEKKPRKYRKRPK